MTIFECREQPPIRPQIAPRLPCASAWGSCRAASEGAMRYSFYCGMHSGDHRGARACPSHPLRPGFAGPPPPPRNPWWGRLGCSRTSASFGGLAHFCTLPGRHGGRPLHGASVTPRSPWTRQGGSHPCNIRPGIRRGSKSHAQIFRQSYK